MPVPGTDQSLLERLCADFPTGPRQLVQDSVALWRSCLGGSGLLTPHGAEREVERRVRHTLTAADADVDAERWEGVDRRRPARARHAPAAPVARPLTTAGHDRTMAIGAFLLCERHERRPFPGSR
jgi:hypothetical protein